MSKETEFAPSWASAPGETIEELLQDRNWSPTAFAEAMDWKVEAIHDLLAGKVRICRALADRLAKVLGSSAKFWTSREVQYRADLLRLGGNEGAPALQWLKELPIKDMVKFGWIEPSKNKLLMLSSCLNFFDVSSIEDWETIYAQRIGSTAFRTSPKWTSSISATAAWLRQGEIEASHVRCDRWNRDGLLDRLLQMRALSRTKDPHLFLPPLQKLCAECGVAVITVRSPNGCRASGATSFLSPEKALLLLSFRFLSDDHFWFTFFHEIGHLILHSQNKIFIESSHAPTTREEREANDFSEETLIPLEFREEFLALGLNGRDIVRFARKIGVSPGIVVGQLQWNRKLTHTQLNNLKARFTWSV